MAKIVKVKVSSEVLLQDMEKFRQRAIEIGATDAKIITTDMVIIDERVRAKCTYPKCDFYGTNANCPPHAMDLDQVRKLVESYRYAIFTMLRCGTREIIKETNQVQAKNYEIVGRLEAEAFYEGYHLALAFGGGPCKQLWCPDQDCAVLQGHSCRVRLKSRSSMEGEGMDAFSMAINAGWEIYPIGTNMDPKEAPYGTKLGIVFIY
ncbi:MAG TPA: DUF2284 domain-containing protein [Proteobacteria bacterium]|nr:DUF2284 domain-containing protein [Pseudomonadota bacterium]